MWVCGTSDLRTGPGSTWASSFISASTPPQTHGEMNFQFLGMPFSVAEHLVIERDLSKWSVHHLCHERVTGSWMLEVLDIYFGFNFSHCNLVPPFFQFYGENIVSWHDKINVWTSYLSCYRSWSHRCAAFQLWYRYGWLVFAWFHVKSKPR